MFEKEEIKRVAEEYVMGTKAKEAIQKQIPYFEFAQMMYVTGAEFGYNKAKEDADKMKSRFLELCNLKDMRIEELEKTNEWHYVNWKYFADIDYPKSESALYLVQLRNKDTLICEWETEEGFGYFYDSNLEPIDNDDVYAWKEIVLPELKESE